jgi:hypothetical protein
MAAFKSLVVIEGVLVFVVAKILNLRSLDYTVSIASGPTENLTVAQRSG